MGHECESPSGSQPSPISCCEDMWRVGGWKALVARGHEAVMRTAVPCLSLGVAALCGGGAFPGPLAGSVRLTSSAALVAPRAANVCMQAYSDASAEPPSDFSGSAGFAAPTSTTAVGIGGAGGDAGAAAGGMEQQRWDDSSFDNSASSFDANMWDNGSAAPTAAVVPAAAASLRTDCTSCVDRARATAGRSATTGRWQARRACVSSPSRAAASGRCS